MDENERKIRRKSNAYKISIDVLLLPDCSHQEEKWEHYGK